MHSNVPLKLELHIILDPNKIRDFMHFSLLAWTDKDTDSPVYGEKLLLASKQNLHHKFSCDPLKTQKLTHFDCFESLMEHFWGPQRP